MENLDNKTKLLNEIELKNYKQLLENNPIHIATVNNEGKPNLAIASDVKVLDSNTLLISINQMIHTPDNIIANSNIVLTCFNENFEGIRLTGTATVHLSGEYFELCNQFFKNDNVTPKGAIIIEVKQIEIII